VCVSSVAGNIVDKLFFFAFMTIKGNAVTLFEPKISHNHDPSLVYNCTFFRNYRICNVIALQNIQNDALHKTRSCAGAEGLHFTPQSRKTAL